MWLVGACVGACDAYAPSRLQKVLDYLDGIADLQLEALAVPIDARGPDEPAAKRARMEGEGWARVVAVSWWSLQARTWTGNHVAGDLSNTHLCCLCVSARAGVAMMCEDEEPCVPLV